MNEGAEQILWSEVRALIKREIKRGDLNRELGVSLGGHNRTYWVSLSLSHLCFSLEMPTQPGGDSTSDPTGSKQARSSSQAGFLSTASVQDANALICAWSLACKPSAGQERK